MQRRVSRGLQLDPKSHCYKSRRPAQAVIEEKIKWICQTRICYGHRRVHVLLRREGWMINWKKRRRVYRELNLQIRSSPPKRRVKAAIRGDRATPSRAHQTWAIEIVHDQWATGSKLRILTILDPFPRFSPTIDPRFSYRSEDVVATL